MASAPVTERYSGPAVLFGPFRLDPARRSLTRDGQAVAVQPRVLELLIYMTANPGRVLTKDELLKALWPDSFVEESNLAQNVSQLRKTLGNGEAKLVQTVSGRGYVFVGDVQVEPPKVPEADVPLDTVGNVKATSRSGTAPGDVQVPRAVEVQRRWGVWTACAAVLLLAVAGGAWRYARLRAAHEHAGTPSTDAYRAAQLGSSLRTKGDELGAQRALQMAIRLDPNYAYAHAELAASYQTTNQLERSREEFGRAHELSGTASPRDKIFIESQYDQITGDWESAVQDYRLAAELYPDNPTYPGSAANALNYLGRYDEAVAAARKAYAMKPAGPFATLLALTLRRDNQPAESLKVVQPELAKRPGGWMMQAMAIQDMLLLGDSPGAERELSVAENGPGRNQAIGYRGRLESSRGHFAAAVRQWQESDTLLRHTDQAGTADDQIYMAVPYLVAVGQVAQAAELFARVSNTETDGDRAVCLALLGREDEARVLMAKLRAERPRDTILNFVLLPEAEAVMDLAAGRAADAVTALKVTVPYDLHEYAALFWRGQAYLALQDGDNARRQFDSILKNPGIDPASPLYVLSWLGRARAERMARDFASARADYGRFLSVWRDADKDIPQVGQARSELASLPAE